MTTRTETLVATMQESLGDKAQSITHALGEVTVVLPVAQLDATMRMLRDRAELR